MGKEKKDKKKGQTMTLSDFVGPTGGAQTQQDDMSWALDGKNWDAEEEGGEAVPGQPRKIFARTAGSMNNFREGTHAQGSRVVDYNMEKPYLGFVANLLTNLPDSEVREFFSDANLPIENIKMIYKDRSTFAFVEFKSPQDLQLALLLEGKFLKNRPVKVDIATQDQREKMMNDKARGMVGAAGGAKSPNAPFPDRDAMGSEQRSFNSLGERHGPRSTTSANPPRDFSDFSRDTMGGAQPQLSSEIGGNRRTPNSSAPSGGSFPNFRDGDKVEQPRMPRQTSKDSVGGRDKDKEGGSWRGGGSKVASPTTKTEGSNWRDSVKVEQPTSWRDQPAAEQPNPTAIERRPKKDETAPKKEEKKEEQPAAPKATPAGKTLQIGGETQPQPKKSTTAVPVPAPPPKVSAWGTDRLSNFRNKE